MEEVPKENQQNQNLFLCDEVDQNKKRKAIKATTT